MPKLPQGKMTIPGAGGLVALSGLDRDRREVHIDGDYSRFLIFVKLDIETDVNDFAILHIIFFAF